MAIVMLTQVWIITPIQHIISGGVVAVSVIIYQTIKRIYVKSHTISLLDIGLDMCICAIISIIITIIFSQIVFISMSYMENIMALMMGVLFYSLSIQAVIILPNAMQRRIRLRKLEVALE